MLNSLFIMTHTGEILIERHYRGHVSRSVAETFYTQQVQKYHDNPKEILPVIATAKHYIVHVFKHDMFFIGIVQIETQPMMVTELLHRVVETLEQYTAKVSEDTIKQHFVTVYQLLDEMIDNGYPITTEISLLKDLVKVPTSVVKSVVDSAVNLRASSGTGRSPVPWRKMGVKYANNEIFFDLAEEMTCIVDVNGMSALCEINGKVMTNCKLSGMPDLLLQFKEPSLIEDCSFHPCVRYARYEQDRSISFIPPDGEFVLMSYRVTNLPMAPIYCRPQLSFSEDGTHGNVNIMLGLRQTMGKPLEEVRVDIPLPPVESHTLKPSQGSVHYDSKAGVLRWNVGKIEQNAKTSPSVSGNIVLPPKSGISKRGPSAVSLHFKLPTVALSNLKVDSVQLKSEKYKPYKGVRYMTNSGLFEIRTC